MPSHLKLLAKKGLLLTPPGCVIDSSIGEYQTGSESYGVSSGSSDFDMYAICIPSKEEIFPHLKGDIQGFGEQKKKFESYVPKHKVVDVERRKEYDIQSHSIVKYFNLLLKANPQCIDVLFVPQRCVLFETPIGYHIRENRKLFLNKKVWHSFKGYAYAQMSKLQTKEYSLISTELREIEEKLGLPNLEYEDSKKVLWSKLPVAATELVDRYKELWEKGMKLSLRFERCKLAGFDYKFSYHVVRLLNEVEQILTEGDLDIESNREQLKSIRRGEWTLLDIQNYFQKKERELETVYTESKLPWGPDESKIKTLLLDCLEMHFGSLKDAVVRPDKALSTMEEICSIVDRYRGLT